MTLATSTAPPVRGLPVPVAPPTAATRPKAGRSAGRSGWARRNWLPICVLALMMASDYKVRVRSAQNTLSGGADLFVLLEVAVYAAVAGYLLLSQAAPPRLRRMPVALFVTTAYVALLVVSAGYSPYRSLALVRAAEVVVLLALTTVACGRATRDDVHRLAHGFLGLVGASVVFGIVFPMGAVSSQQVGRFTWLKVHPVPAGAYAGLATLIAVIYLLTRHRDRPGPRWPTWVYAVLLLLVGGGMLATQTRSAVLGAAVGILLALLSLYRGRRLIVVVLGFLLLVPAVVLAALPTLSAYFARGESSAQLATLNSRTSLWGLAYDAFRHSPVYGYGLGATRGLFLDQTGLGGAHNAIINVAVDLGGLGLVLWVALLLVVARNALRYSAAAPDGRVIDRTIILAALGFLLVDGFFYEGFGAVSNAAGDWLFVLVLWVVVLDRSSPPAGTAAPRPLVLPRPAFQGRE